MKTRYLLLVFFISLWTYTANAQFVPEIFSQIKSGEKIKQRLNGSFPKYIDTITDDKFPQMVAGSSWRNSFKHRSVYDRLTLSIKDTTKAMQKIDYLFYFTVDTFDCQNRRGSFDVMMRLSYDPASHKAYIDKVVYQFAHTHKIIVKLNSIVDSAAAIPGQIDPNDLQTNFNLETEIIVERYYLGSYSTPVTSLSHTYIGKDKLKISWLPPSTSAPNKYELEWAYIDTSGVKPDSLKYDFKLNSTRVNLSKTNYVINTVYDAGIIIYRVRRVKPDSVHFKYDKHSDWYPINQPNKGYVKNYSGSHKLYIKSHEDMGKNWDYQISFAEEGLKKEVVNYFDGSLKRRQGVTLLNTNNFALVDESIYDNHGREAIKIIPAPSDSNTIRYYQNFNQNVAGKHYSSRDFDTSTTMADKCNGNYTAKPVGTQSGAGRYYSTSNPDKSNENAAIPDAQGYPIVQSQVMPDPTGRIYAQGGVGKTHQLGSGHETKYTYGTASQEELDQLFGSEMGVASHYKKNSVTDPNGQVSVSYIDQHGRVVATALTGGVPGMVDSLANFKKAEFTMLDLTNNNMKMANSLVTRYDFDANEAGTHKIFYKLEAPDFKFGCIGYKPCYSCIYDLSVSLFDDCGAKLMDFKRTIGKLNDTSCAPLAFNLKDSVSKILGASASGDSISFYLNKGHYHLYKTLTVNSDSVQERIDKFVDNDSNCFKPFKTFLEEEIGQIDYSDCYCDTCGMDTLSYCDTRKLLMLEDVSPNGQYFTYDELTYNVTDASSILRNSGALPLYSTIDASQFKNDKGEIDTIWIDKSQGAYMLPTELTVAEFVEHWKESWAEALLPLHPEYCYYQYCINNLNKSNLYDEAMMEVDNYDSALVLGYLDPLNNRSEYAISNHDPLFVNLTNGNLNALGNVFKTELESLSSFTVGGSNDPLLISASSSDLWQISKAIGYCKNISDSLQRQSCFKFYFSNEVSNQWMNDEQGRDNYWAKFKALYYQIKHKFIEKDMNDSVSGTYCIKKVGPTCDNSNYRDKVSHFNRYESSNPLENVIDSFKKEKNRLLDSLNAMNTCETSIEHWDNALKYCTNYATHRDSILYHLLKVCESGSLNPKSPNIMGSSDVPSSLTKGKRFVSFEQVLKYFIGNNYKTVLCNIDLINSPRQSNTDYEDNKPTEANDCICDKVKEEIKLFKGCYTSKDSNTLSAEGQLVNDLMNGIVKNGLISLGASTPTLDNYSDLTPVANKLFAPVIGGNASTISIMEKVQTTYLNEKTFTIYNGTELNGCTFAIRLLNNLSNFTNIDITKKSTIKPISQGVFEYTFYYTGGGSGKAHVYNTCFNNLGKCSPNLSTTDFADFTNYFNDKHHTALTLKEIEALLYECQGAGAKNQVYDKLGTMYITSGICPDYLKKYSEPMDIHLINTLNQMMRPATYRGFKRYLTENEYNYNCNVADFLTLTKDYRFYKHWARTKKDNYWWVSPKYTISKLVIGTDTINDTLYVNNYNKDPYFVGGFWIGARCADVKDSSCFTSFGDPYKKLGVGSRPTLSQIDSLNHMKWSDDLGCFTIVAYKRTSPSDSVILTIRNGCRTYCHPIFKLTQVQLNFKEVFIKPGASGAMKMSNVKATVGYKFETVNPFMDMINGLAKANKLISGSETDIRQYKKSFKLDNYYEQLLPIANAHFYKNESSNDSVLIGQLGTASGVSPAKFCKFGLRKAGSVRNWNFNAITVFKELRTDNVAIADAIYNDQIEMANYHFTIKAGKVNSPGDTTWYDLRGWSSCWKFTDITMVTGDGKPVFYLPPSFVGNCRCLTCPETKKWSDSLYAEYPALYPSHSNYITIVTNYINRKLNTTLSFDEIQSQWDACDVGNRTWIKLPETDYRLAVKNTNSIGHADSALASIMYNTGLYFEARVIQTSDSLIYLLDFKGLTQDDIKTLHDSINKYFSAPYTSDFKKQKYYRNSDDISIYSLTDVNIVAGCSKSAFDNWFSSIKTNVFASASITNNSTSGIKYGNNYAYELPASTSWMSKINIQALNHNQRKLFSDTLRKWKEKCKNVELYFHYYLPELTASSSSELCLKPKTGGGSEKCYNCDSFTNRILDYQYNVAAKRKYPSAAMDKDSIALYLSAAMNRKLEVKESQGDCIGCGNQALYVCEESSERLDSVVSLLNKLAKNKKLNSSNYTFTGAYTTLLNSIKPAGIKLNAPKYQMSGITGGGMLIKLIYNNIDYDFIEVADMEVDSMRKFVKGIDLFKNAWVLPSNGVSNAFTLMSVDSLYKPRAYYFKMTGLEASRCCEIQNTVLCPQPYTREYQILDPPCHEAETQQAFANAVVRHQNYIDSIKRQLKMDYEIHCLIGAKEKFKLGLFQQRYHLTLYYYDQAGNLTKTVPPQGVKELNLANKKDSILAYRNNIAVSNKFVNTYHHLPTNYQYNSLNQLVWQKTPDGGQSRFWYDRLGRLMLSQNANQMYQSNSSQKIYSYTRYDALGRIAEVGQIVNTPVDSVQMLNNIDYFNTWLNNSYARTQITKTFYDYAVMPSALAEFSEGQRNLRGRVSSVAYYDYFSSDSTQYSRATHYSYDIHGNVDHLVHDFPELNDLGHRFKHIAYKYDLISGKVHEVAYQQGQADQWYHRYQYDADNRLTLAETSTDKVIWDKDAEYKYYKHGPLARTILGEHAVQGVDYAYTLHGWLKGVNSNTLQASRDIGKDGTGNLRKYTARDAYGFTLGYFTDNTATGYFDGDYKSIGSTQFEASTASSPLANNAANMYNGNITHMVTAVGVLMARNAGSPVATSYRYDQLNRLSTVHTYNGIDMTNNQWSSGTLQTAWHEKFKYDANGNISKLQRYSAVGIMDDLTYSYKDRSNQLTQVNDNVNSGDYKDDVDNQTTTNYHYDKIGNLVQDDAEQISNIEWTVYGKIKTISRYSNAGNKPDLEFNYDAAGQRVSKIVKRTSNQTNWQSTYYARDAQGNTMATYSKKYSISQDTALYRKINNEVVNNVGASSFAEFINTQYLKNSQFAGALTQAVVNKGMYSDLVDLYNADSLLAWNPALHQMVLYSYCNHANSTEQSQLNTDLWNNMKDSILLSCNLNYLGFVESVLVKDASDELLNQLATIDLARVHTIYYMLGGAGPTPPLATVISFIRSQPNGVVSSMINMQFSHAEITTALQGCSTSLLISVTDPSTGSYSFCAIVQNIPNCGNGVVTDAWLNFVKTYISAALIHTIIKAESNQEYLVNLILNHAGCDGVVSINKDAIALALSSINTLSLTEYLMKIHQHLGSWVYDNVINTLGEDIVVKKEFVLDELHIYGSSRHGIHKPKRVLLNSSYKINNLDSAIDSTQCVQSYNYFKRTLTLKQYELTNHLGNVLATVLDRKTFVQDSTGADTLLYYKADVSTATLYYAFGSAIQELSYSSDTTNKYRFGFNNQEMDHELGEYYAFEYRIHDARIGRFLSVDPLANEYPWNSTYAFAENNVLLCIDLEGKEALNTNDELNDPYFMSRLLLTSAYDVKHSIYNLMLHPVNYYNTYYSNKAPTSYVARYKKNSYGEETFETEIVNTIYEGPESQYPPILLCLDLLNVYGAKGLFKYKANDFILGVRDFSLNAQTTRFAKEYILKTVYKAVNVTKNLNLGGKWVEVTRNQNGMEFQSLLSGKPYNKITKKIKEYLYNGVKFDGYSNGILYETKDDYTSFIKNGKFEEWFSGKNGLLNEARSQIQAANGNKLQWIFSNQESLDVTYDLLKNDATIDISKIEFKLYTPK